jgi:nucleotide-binding universal stress UspA family protein
MITIKRILCPTDLSREADEALRYAVALTCAYGAKLFLLYCKETKSNGENEQGAPKEAGPLFAESIAPHLGLTNLCDLDWQGLVAFNVADVGRAIVAEADQHQIDLIVMRSRRRPYAAALVGSTAETVSRTAPCPVLITHPSEREWVGLSTGEIDLKRVLVAHDFSPDSKLALNYGISLAQEYQAEVHLLHVLNTAGKGEPELAWSSSSGGSAYTFVAQRLQQAVPKEVYLWCNLVNVVRSGKVYEEVLTYAKEREIDLICMGVSGSDWSFGKFFGSNVDRVLRQAPCPVLVARPTRQARTSQSLDTKGGNGSELREVL